MSKGKIGITSQNELALMRESCKLAAKTLKFAVDLTKPGISTGKIDRMVEEYIRDNNAIPAPLNYKGFPKSICTSVNEVVCHGIPSDTHYLKDGDIVNIDVTTILNGYYGDTSTMVAVGDVSEQALKLIRVTLECLQKSIAVVKPGVYTGEIGDKIEEHATKFGFSVVRDYTGHGVGKKFHDEPIIWHYSGKKGVKMHQGMTFTIEPMINEGTWRVKTLKDCWTAVTQDKRLSAQFEHTLIVTKTGVEILTLLEDSDSDAPGGNDY
ncbi:MAG: type I methionyl aminopeptidase [Planctomycetes bacterium]|nr:type I methionyl aminopeptidase [Planctomycetota bacterium]